MADYLTGDNNYQTTEHYLRRVLAGNVENVRRRLNIVLERLDYDFIDEGEFHIESRRNARGWASAYASADVLDYPRTLIIKLKPLSENSTRASFAYTIKHPSLNRGEKEVLTREAETISTLATTRAKDKVCTVCGTESDDDSRFCRKCGTPMTGDETAIEVLRMTAEIRSGHTSVVSSAIVMIITTLLTSIALIILLSGDTINKGIYLMLVTSVFISLINIMFISFGWKRLNNALKSNSKEQKIIIDKRPQTLADDEKFALPPAPLSFSVTEETTDILEPDILEPEKISVPVNREKHITNDLN